MSYATIADAFEIYGETYIRRVCDRDPQDDVIDTASFERHLAIASQEMDGYMLGRYPLPLAENGYVIPETFVKRCVDIAVYNSTPDADTRTEEMTKRYDDSIKYMEMIAQNKVKIPLALIATPTTPANVINESQRATTTPGRAIVSTSPARLFTSDNTRRIL